MASQSLYLEFLRYVGFYRFKYSLPVFVDGSVEILGAFVDIQRLFIVGFVILLIAALYLFTHFTKVGLAFRGIAQEEHTRCRLDQPRQDCRVEYGYGLCSGSLVAIVILPLGYNYSDSGLAMCLSALICLHSGGLGSTFGVILASFIIGYAQTITATYVSAHWTMIVSLIAILIILAIKPSGLLTPKKS